MTGGRSTAELFSLRFRALLARQQETVARLAAARVESLRREVDTLTQPILQHIRDIRQYHDRRVSALQRLQRQLQEGFARRWVGLSIRPNSIKSQLSDREMPVAPTGLHVPSDAADFDETERLLKETLKVLESTLPPFPKWRATVWQREQPMVQAALTASGHAIAREQQESGDRVARQVVMLRAAVQGLASKSSLLQADRTRTDSLTAKASLAKLSGSVGEGIPAPPVKVRKGHGRLLFQCGWTSHQALLRTENQSAVMGPATLFVPCLLDLTQEHGFVTTDANTVKSFLLRLLHTLPAGSVTLRVYDPKSMGDFVNYLYPLGDKQDHILGSQGVLSTQTQLQQLLEETERRIGVINQRYLAGKYADLVAYNMDAGVSFEPYRVLVFHDNPTSWANNYRQDLMSQLTRIISAGAKCGVFVIVKSDTPCSIGLPLFVPGQPTVTRYAAGPTTAPRSPQVMQADHLLRAGNAEGCYALEETVGWVPPDDSWLDSRGEADIIHRLERELQHAGTVEVSPKNVAAIARFYRQGQSGKGVAFGPPVLDLDSEVGWWAQSSIEGLYAYVGIDKANQKKPRIFQIRGTQDGFGVLVGGQPGSGKSTFLHVLISELIRRYSPAELELCLIDVKFGAEFKHYAKANLPHAIVIALETGAEFAVSVLQDLIARMADRYRLFTRTGVSNIEDYRRKTRRPMPRTLAIIDEFTAMFEVENSLSEEAAACLTKLIQQGRAAGIHLVLASQSLSTAVAIPRNVLPQVPQRVVFKMPEQDSRMFLADNNPKGSELTRAGEGIYNPHNGLREANEEFQGTLMSHVDLRKTLLQVAGLATRKGAKRRPILLENPGATAWTRDGILAAKRAVSGLRLSVPLGLPLSLQPCVCLTLQQTVSGNALVCIHSPQVYTNIVSSIVLASAFGGAGVLLLDFGGLSGEFARSFAKAESFLLHRKSKAFRVLREGQIDTAVRGLKLRVERAIAQSKAPDTPLVVVATGLSQAANLNQLSPVALDFQELLGKGAAVGIHVVVAADALGTVKSKLGYQWADHFSAFVSGICGSGDSMELVQSRMAASLGHDDQVILYDRLAGKAYKVRPFRLSSFPIR